MIERYTLPEMGEIWSTHSRFQRLLDVEKAVAKVQGAMGLIPEPAAHAILASAGFDVKQISEIEKTTKHDVIAFVTSVCETVNSRNSKEFGKYVHFGLTSSDVLDTALSLQIRDAYQILQMRLSELDTTLADLVVKHADTICVGRTHGIHAEPTTWGLKLAGYLAELKRNRVRIQRACEQVAVVKLSGAVGTYSLMSEEVEAAVAKELKLPSETVATQVIPRDRHAEVFSSLAILGGGLERLATELRHLQRTEVGEIEEAFSTGQKGSSAMPHKKNPIGSENITGLARLLRGYLLCSMEDIALWHERDISHSSVERVIFPDAFIVADYAVYRTNQILVNLKVNPAKMKTNLDLTQGQVFSSHVLLELIKKGLTREDAYHLIQKNSHELKNGQSLKEALMNDSNINELLSEKEFSDIFSGKSHLKSIQKIIERVVK